MNLFFKDEELRAVVSKLMRHEVYQRIRSKGEEESEGAQVLPFKRVPAEDVRPFVNAVPVYDLKVAAGRFSAPQIVQEVPQHEEVQDELGAAKYGRLRAARDADLALTWLGERLDEIG